MQYQRLLLLMDALGSTPSKERPKGVGMKTLIEARDKGLIEIIGDIRNIACVLTEEGRALQQRVNARLTEQTWVAASMASSSTETAGD